MLLDRQKDEGTDRMFPKWALDDYFNNDNNHNHNHNHNHNNHNNKPSVIYPWQYLSH